MGYDTHNPVILLRTLICLQIYYVTRVIFLFLVLYPLKKYSSGRVKDYFRRSLKSLAKTLFFSEILAIIFGSLIELLIAGTLFQSIPEANPNDNVLNHLISIYYIIVPIIVIPGLFFWMFTKSLS